MSTWVYISDRADKTHQFVHNKAREWNGNVVSVSHHLSKIVPTNGSNMLKNGQQSVKIYHGETAIKMPWLLARTDVTDIAIDVSETTRQSHYYKQNYDLLIAPLLKNVQIHYITPYLPAVTRTMSQDDTTVNLDLDLPTQICDHDYEEKWLLTSSYWACKHCGEDKL